MTFATEKRKLASDRFALVRVKPSRDITSLLASEGSGVYSYSWDHVVPSMTRNGSALSRVNAAPTVDDTFYYNKTEKKVYVKLASAPNVSTNIIIMDYYLFSTNEIIRATTEDPITPGVYTEEHQWLPRLKDTPATKQSVKNLLTGTLSLSASALNLINVDNEYNQYFTLDDSWNKKEVIIWYGINSIDNLQKVFEGAVKDVTFSIETLKVTLVDKLTILSAPAYMGDTRLESIFLDEAGSFPDVYEGHANRPCRYIVGSSPAGYLDGSETDLAFTGINAGGGTTRFSAWHLDHTKCLEATCLSNEPIDSSSNREWALARTDVLKEIDFGTITSATLEGSGSTPEHYIECPGVDPVDIFVIDTTNQNFHINDGSNKTAVIPVGRYTTSQLVQELESQLNAVSTYTWTVSFSSGNFTFKVSSSVTIKLTNGTNDIWSVLGFTPTTSDRTGTTFTTDANRDPYGNTRAKLTVVASGHNIEVGDTWLITNSGSSYKQGSGHNVYGIVCVEVTGTGYDCVVRRTYGGRDNPSLPSSDENWAPSGSVTWFTPQYTLGLVIEQVRDNQLYVPICRYNFTQGSPLYVSDYGITVTATSGGNDLVKIEFQNGFEDFPWWSDLGMTTLHPSTHRVYFRLSSDNNLQNDLRHADFASTLASKGGISVTSASVTQANTDLDAHCMFTIPEQSESSYKTYFYYLEQILKSTLGYISLNNSSGFDYNLYKLPSSTDERNHHLIIKDSFQVKVTYSDIITELVTTNPHYHLGKQGSTLNSEQVVNNASDLYLHGIEQTDTLEHVLTDMSSRAQDIVDLRSKRIAIYSFSVATEDLDSQIGDDIKIIFENVLGASTIIEGKIISIDKSLDSVKLQVADLKGL